MQSINFHSPLLCSSTKTLISPNPKSLILKTPQTSKTLTLLSSFIKPSLIAVTASAALLLSRHPKSSLACLPPPPVTSQSQTLTDAEKSQTLEEYLDSYPDDIGALRALMELKIKSNLFSDAISLIDRILDLQPNNLDLPILRAHLLFQSGEPDSAHAAFEEILARDPLSVEAYHGLVMIEKDAEDGDLDTNLTRIKSAMEICRKEKRKDDLRDFKLLEAQIMVVKGEYEKALRVYKELVKEEPRDFRPYLCQGIVYSVMRKKKDAERMYEKYRRLVPRGHPYAEYFNDNVVAMKVFSQLEENRINAARGQKIGGR